MLNSAINRAVSTPEEGDAAKEAADREQHRERHGYRGIPISNFVEPPVPGTDLCGSEGVPATDEAAGEAGPTADQQRPASIPNEPLKTLLALGGLAMSMLLTAVSLSVVHEYLPERPPLPDIALQVVPNLPGTITVCEILLLTNMGMAFTVSLLHRYRCVVLRRVFFIIGIIFVYRSICIAVTAMPNPNSLSQCEPKTNGSLTFGLLTWRVIRVAVGGGFTVSRSHNLCGDSIFSGHTASLIISYLVICRYAPQSARPLRWVSLLVCLASFVFLLLSHGHYTVDLIIAYWLASRLWWIFHTLADEPNLRRPSCHLARVWWFPIFQYLEGNVPCRLPCEMQLPWPRGCLRRAYQRFRMHRPIGTVWTRVRGLIN